VIHICSPLKDQVSKQSKSIIVQEMLETINGKQTALHLSKVGAAVLEEGVVKLLMINDGTRGLVVARREC